MALVQAINGGVPSAFILTINGRNKTYGLNTTNGTAMFNLTGLPACVVVEISVTALNCAGSASGDIHNQLLCKCSALYVCYVDVHPACD